MMLQRISIQNFKSLKDVTLDLQKVNLLIGPNNSGKSNLLKALTVIGQLGFERTNKKAQENISETDFYKKLKNEKILFEMILEKVYPGTKSNYGKIEIKNGIVEHLSIQDPLREGIHFSDFIFWQNPITGEDQEIWLMDKDNFYYPISSYFRIFFENVLIYKPDPNKYSKPFPLLPNQELVESDASNLIAFFDIVRDRYPESFQKIEKDLAKCIPEFSSIRFMNVEVNAEDELFKIYGTRSYKKLGLYNQEQEVTYWADELSEGTLYFLALLCIINQPNPPKLLLLEEPEKGIHPRRIKEVIDLIFQLSEEKDIQIILTTHSERALDEFEDIPESVFVFDKDEEGATLIRNLQKDIIEPSNKEMDKKGLPRLKFTESLGSHWITGFIGGVPK